ncbi:uncharacterized protein LOC104893597 [Beta vulgaris subsp. vulgaris]|uniref:uncharacterized protein LOC104893597 n=1 Tax=Beta vulgaris subsp. vulgaris TaxID=3555 RepID=UPI0025491801|nr:uncharacterized protein LOC104893597 [Beta vulgaris subsp. vulgaris]
MERFLGVVHVANTTSLTLKEAIESLLMEHSLSFSRVRGQGYDGASNMQGAINGLKTLILNESPSAHCVHCFAHQLQLTLVAIAKKNADCGWLFVDVLAPLLNFVGGSPKRKEFLRKKQDERVVAALSLGELESGTGLNQELSLSRPGDTRWNLRNDGWDIHMSKVTLFAIKYGIETPDMEENYKNLKNRFNEVSKELLVCMSSFNPANQFSAFDIAKLTRLAEFYPTEFSTVELSFMEDSLQNFIVDIRSDGRFSMLKNLIELSMKLVETGKHETHSRV